MTRRQSEDAGPLHPVAAQADMFSRNVLPRGGPIAVPPLQLRDEMVDDIMQHLAWGRLGDGKHEAAAAAGGFEHLFHTVGELGRRPGEGDVVAGAARRPCSKNSSRVISVCSPISLASRWTKPTGEALAATIAVELGEREARRKLREIIAGIVREPDADRLERDVGDHAFAHARCASCLGLGDDRASSTRGCRRLAGSRPSSTSALSRSRALLRHQRHRLGQRRRHDRRHAPPPRSRAASRRPG